MTKNFKKEELEAKGFPRYPTPFELFLAEMLLDNVQLVRNEFGDTIWITDCYRGTSKTRDLLNKGYNPSPTSDHFWGQHIPINKMLFPDKYNLHNGFYTLSVGALDLSSKDNKKLYNLLFEFNRKYRDRGEQHEPFGQVIYEKTENTSWIHVSNNIHNVYAERFIYYLLNKKLLKTNNMYLASYDGGVTYLNMEGKKA